MRALLVLPFLVACGGTTAMPTPDAGTTPPPGSDVLALGSLLVPRGTVVREFDFTADGIEPSASTAGGTLVVSVFDRSHPNRDQGDICPSDHPLDGCPTVDYGAFGDIHDNRITMMSSGGPVSFHLYKDRSIRTESEALPPFE